jgi:hypothetical protein
LFIFSVSYQHCYDSIQLVFDAKKIGSVQFTLRYGVEQYGTDTHCNNIKNKERYCKIYRVTNCTMLICSVHFQYCYDSLQFNLEQYGTDTHCNNIQIKNGYRKVYLVKSNTIFILSVSFQYSYVSLPFNFDTEKNGITNVTLRYETVLYGTYTYCNNIQNKEKCCKAYLVRRSDNPDQRRWHRTASLEDISSLQRGSGEDNIQASVHHSMAELRHYAPIEHGEAAEAIPRPPTPPPLPPSHTPSGINQVNEHIAMEFTEQGGEVVPNLGTAHHQCSSARRAGSKVSAISISLDDTFGKMITAEPERVGSLNPPGDREVQRTFHGARAHRNGDLVNQSVSISFDPATMICIACGTEHSIINHSRPSTILISDQNCPPVWPGSTPETCVYIIRVENPSLHELIDLFEEVFARSNLAEGSVILVGAVSYLLRVGVSLYARDWTQVAGRISRDWPNARLGPLVPLLVTDAPGGVARCVIELASWYNRVYTGQTNGFSDCWTKLVNMTISSKTGGTPLAHPENYTIPLPISLHENCAGEPVTFVTNRSRPFSVTKLDQGQQRELLNCLADTLSRDFYIPTGISANTANAAATETASVQEQVTKLVLIGASNLHRAAVHFSSLGYEVLNLCSPGWIATPGNVAQIVEKVRALGLGRDAVFVCDLFGNSAFRFEQFDGSSSMPIKLNGKYHLIGRVATCSDGNFAKIVDNVLPLLGVLPGQLKIVMPPQPRYLFSACCSDPAHCCNLGEEKHSEKLLRATIHLRAQLKNTLRTGSGTGTGTVGCSGTWVADTCCAVSGSPDMAIPAKLSSLKSVSASDGVHLTPEGYRNVAKNISELIVQFRTGTLGKSVQNSAASAAASVSGRQLYFWRGICSPIGSRTRNPALNKSGSKSSRGKMPRPNPYFRGGGGGVTGASTSATK